MRLGEIRNTLRRVLTEDDTISIKHESIFEGQAQIIRNYGEIISALDLMADLKWNEIDFTPIRLIKELYDSGLVEVQLSQEHFNQLNSYVSTLNSKLPFYVSILETMVKDQDEKTVNIKLPNDIKSLGELVAFNERLAKLFKSFQVDGQFEFREFDRGTSWYEMTVIGVYTYRYFIACLKIAQEYFKAETEFFKSREAKVSFQAYKIRNQDLSFEEYQKEWLEAFIKEEIKLLVEEKIKETNGESSESLQSKLVIAATGLIKELGEGTEFHLSLNPPEYAIEQAGQLVIDYKKIQLLKPENETKQILSTGTKDEK
jgi:hypothetical protein